MDLMETLMRAGFLSAQPVEIDGTSLPAIEVTRALLQQSEVSRRNPVWAYGLVVEVKGEKDGRSFTCIYRNQHPSQEIWGGQSAYYKNVGIPLSIGAQLIAEGRVTAKGVQPPEMAFPIEPFFEALALRDIMIEETIVQDVHPSRDTISG